MKSVCKRHATERVEEFLEKTKLKHETKEKEKNEKRSEEADSSQTFIPTHADDELIDISAMTSNVIAAVMAGKIFQNESHISSKIEIYQNFCNMYMHIYNNPFVFRTGPKKQVDEIRNQK